MGTQGRVRGNHGATPGHRRCFAAVSHFFHRCLNADPPLVRCPVPAPTMFRDRPATTPAQSRIYDPVAFPWRCRSNRGVRKWRVCPQLFVSGSQRFELFGRPATQRIAQYRARTVAISTFAVDRYFLQSWHTRCWSSVKSDGVFATKELKTA